MLKNKINTTIGLIDDVVDNKNIANENANVAKRNSSFFDSLEKVTPMVQSYILARKNFSFNESEALSLKLHDIMNYSKDIRTVISPLKPTLSVIRASTVRDLCTTPLRTLATRLPVSAGIILFLWIRPIGLLSMITALSPMMV